MLKFDNHLFRRNKERLKGSGIQTEKVSAVGGSVQPRFGSSAGVLVTTSFLLQPLVVCHVVRYHLVNMDEDYHFFVGQSAING